MTESKENLLKDWEWESNNEEVTITKYKGTDEEVIMPSVIENKPVVCIGECAFFDRKSLTNINISAGVKKIGWGAFYGCSSLTNINLPDSVNIGERTFFACSSLTNINIPDGVTGIGRAVFYGCSSLTNINFPAGVKEIGDCAFKGCTSLTNINIPDSVTGIGHGAFKGCSLLTNINIPDSVEKIGNRAFKGCPSLTNINIPDSVTSIGEDAFYGCSSLINIPEAKGSLLQDLEWGEPNDDETIVRNIIDNIDQSDLDHYLLSGDSTFLIQELENQGISIDAEKLAKLKDDIEIASDE